METCLPAGVANSIPFAVVPYFRQTGTTRFAKTNRSQRAQRYVEWVAKTRDWLREHCERLPDKTPLVLSAEFYIGPARDTKGRLYDREKKIDLNNCVKALEDALQDHNAGKVLFPGILADDYWIRAYGQMRVTRCAFGEDRVEFSLCPLAA